MHRRETRRDALIEEYHGTPVADPYRWLEDTDQEETRAWVQAQNAACSAYVHESGQRPRITARLRELLNFPHYSAPLKRAGRYFFSYNQGLQNQAALYLQEELGSQPVLLLDPNLLSSDGTVALALRAHSRDGSLLAYGLSTSGSDWQEIKIRQVASGQDCAETIRWSKYASIAWKHDNSGFYYDRFPEPGSVPPEDQSYFSQVYWHALGSGQQDDRLIYERPEAKELSFAPEISDDGVYLILTVFCGTDSRTRIYYREVESEGPFVHLLDDFDAAYRFLYNSGPIFYIQTNLDAPRGRIVAIDCRRPQREHWRELVPQGDDAIDVTHVINQQLVVVFLCDAHHEIRRYSLAGTYLGSIPLPAPGSITEVTGGPQDSEMFCTFTSFLYPPTVMRYDFCSARPEVWRGAHLDLVSAHYVTTQVWYPSRDGTRIPMFLVHRKDLVLDGTHPTLLSGYGGFNISLTPDFLPARLLWLEHGGIYAQANLRGGGEYGEQWHQAGMRENKQNVFDDFIAAARWLIARGYTCSAKLAINGGSNGGLLVAACMVQQPELYGAVVCEVPVTDMLRYHKFTVGRYWIPEYGNAEETPEDFQILYAYSPLHNVRPGTAYPATLVMAADTDDRVVPSHAMKFAATVQAATSGEAPILLRIETQAGHGFGKPLSKVVQERGDVYAFLFRQFGITAHALAEPGPAPESAQGGGNV
ncbi:MAG TPA: prolyl oligopeptidase family serine peptidase [Ktedonobacteraceae bacterium]|jgi:prolyl oligopeptidase